MLKNKLLFLVLVIIASIPSFFTVLRSGFFPMHDDQHIFRLYEMDKCFVDGQIPCRWIPDGGFGYGYPQFNFYAPSLYYLGEIIHMGGVQYVDAVKIIIVLGFILSGISIYILIKEFYGEFTGFIAAILYIYAPYKAQQVYVRGALSEFWAGVLFPLVLWAFYKLITEGKKKYLLLSGIFTGLLFLTHNLLSMVFLPLLFVWVFYWLSKSKTIKGSLKKSFGAYFLGTGVSAFFLLPMLAERKFVHLETLIGGYFDYRQHFVSLRQLFFDNTWGYGSSVLGPVDDIALSVGPVHWVLGVLAVLAAVILKKKNIKMSGLILVLGAVELFVLFMMHERSSFIWRTLPNLAFVQFPWRLLSISTLLLTVTGAYFIANSGKMKYLLGALAAIGVLVLHLGFFVPKSWYDTNDRVELSGQKFERQLTSSIGDYLPIYANFPPDKKAGDLPEVVKGSVEFSEYKKGTDYQTGKIVAVEDSRIRLPLFDFPGMTVKLNGNRIKHVSDDCTGEPFCKGLISFDVPAGKHEFVVELKNTPVRTIGNWISLFSIVFVLVSFIKLKLYENKN
jgi:hypothetical protein